MAQRLLRHFCMLSPHHLSKRGGNRPLPTLDAIEERRQARHLHELRCACWSVALSEPALAERLHAVVREEHGTAVPERVVAWRAGPQAAVAAMLQADPYGSVLERLHAVLVPDQGPVAQRFRFARAEYLCARNRFICANLRFVYVVAKRYGESYMTFEDRVQEGNIGLLKATDRFDPELGFRFSTYAAWWIRHTVIRALVKQGRTVRIPAHIHTLFTRARRARNELHNELCRDPTLVEIAARIETPLANVTAAIAAMELRSVGLDDPAMGEQGIALGEVLPDEDLEGWADRIGERIDAKLADEALRTLDDRTFDIVVRRFGLRGMERQSLRSLGEDHRLSRERVRQLQNAALQRLRTEIESRGVLSIAGCGP